MCSVWVCGWVEGCIAWNAGGELSDRFGLRLGRRGGGNMSSVTSPAPPPEGSARLGWAGCLLQRWSFLPAVLTGAEPWPDPPCHQHLNRTATRVCRHLFHSRNIPLILLIRPDGATHFLFIL